MTLTPTTARHATGPEVGTPESSPHRLLRLVLHQMRADRIVLTRNMQAQFFGLALPIVFLVLFVSIFGNELTDVDGHWVRQSTYYVPAIMVFTVVDGAFMTPLVGLVTQREMGILKRRRMTPEPSWVLVIGRACTLLLGTATVVALLVGIAHVAYDVPLPVERAGALAVYLLAGVVTFCSLAFAASRLVRSADDGMAVAGALSLPLFFVSGVFIPWATVPAPLQAVASVFPVRPLSHAMVHVFDPATEGTGLVAADLAVLAAWAAVGLVAARRWFSWLPLSQEAAG